MREPIRVLILTGADGQVPQDLLDAAKQAFAEPRCFTVRVKLHPIRYNPTGRLLGRFYEELRHWWFTEDLWWWLQRAPRHFIYIKRTEDWQLHKDWPDVVVYDTTALWKEFF